MRGGRAREVRSEKWEVRSEKGLLGEVRVPGGKGALGRRNGIIEESGRARRRSRGWGRGSDAGSPGCLSDMDAEGDKDAGILGWKDEVDAEKRMS